MLSRIKFEKRSPKMGGLLLCQTEKPSGTAINAPRSEDGHFLVCVVYSDGKSALKGRLKVLCVALTKGA